MTENKSANKGEWSELLVFAKVAHDAYISMCDADLKIIPNKVLKVEDIIRGATTFSVSNQEKILRKDDQDVIIEIEKANLPNKISSFQDEILAAAGAFESQHGNDLLAIFGLTKVKAASAQKADIDLTILDPKTALKSEASFSIKSYLGNPSTLLNASKHNTNFQFKIENFNGNVDAINRIESKSKVRDRIQAITEDGGGFVFNDAKGCVFNRNLLKIDSLMPAILGNLTLANSILTKRGKKIIDVVQSDILRQLTSSLPIHLDAELIAYKVKSLLLDVALGMVPNTAWDGRQTADGGYIVVKLNGDLVCFHVYNFGEFSDYIYKNTKFDTPSTTKHEYGFLYAENGELFFDMNCQIRFT